MWWAGWPLALLVCHLRGRKRARRPAALKPPVPDASLAAWRRIIGKMVEQAAGHGGAAAEPRDEALVAFRSRYGLEREVRALWERAFGQPAPRRGMTLLLEPLVAEGALPPQMAEAIEVVARVAGAGVHAQGISETQVQFLQEVAPLLAAALREVRAGASPPRAPA